MLTKRKRAYKEAAERDNKLCQVCGSMASDVHHIVYRSHGGADIPENLICLCRVHHEAAHKDEKLWRNQFIGMQAKHYGKLTIEKLKGL